MRTKYEPHDGSLSSRAHGPRRLIYPAVFGVKPTDLALADTMDWMNSITRELDGQRGVDRLVQVNSPGFEALVSLSIQERFRRPPYRDYRDITVTERNHATG